jgi:CBS domain-containing protein
LTPAAAGEGISTPTKVLEDTVKARDVMSRPMLVGEAMTPSLVAMSPEDDLDDVVALMLDTATRSVPIIENGRLVGVVSRRDVLRAVATGQLRPEDVRRHLRWEDVRRRRAR